MLGDICVLHVFSKAGLQHCPNQGPLQPAPEASGNDVQGAEQSRPVGFTNSSQEGCPMDVRAVSPALRAGWWLVD